MKKLLKNTDSKILKEETKKFQNEQKEKIINFSKLSKDEIINLDLSKLDSKNLELFQKFKKESKKDLVKPKRIDQYIFPENVKTKREKSSFRSERRKEMKKILFLIDNEENKEKLKSLISEFEKIYKKWYSLNDYSLNSIFSNTSDIGTLILAKDVLHKIKEFKSKS